MTHPIYGPFILDQWIPVLYPNRTFGNYEVKINAEGFIVRNINTNRHLKPYNSMITIGKGNKCHIPKLLLSSAFPHINSDETVDHIDNNPSNNSILNYQWMSLSENSKKSQEKSYVPRNGQKVILKKKSGEVLGSFKNINLAAVFIKESHKKDISLKSLESKISRAIKNPHFSVYGYQFSLFNNDCRDEIWKPVIIEGNPTIYLASNYGKIKNIHDQYSSQTIVRENPKYKQVSINYKSYYVHRIVWSAFYGNIPMDKEVLHNDMIGILPDGSYRNYLEDLTLGTRSENMISYHQQKDKLLKIVQPIHTQFVEKTPSIDQLVLPPEPTTPFERLMAKPPTYIQYIKPTDKRGSKYVISRLCPGATTDISSSSSKKISDTDKFIQIITLYDQLRGTDYSSQITSIS